MEREFCESQQRRNNSPRTDVKQKLGTVSPTFCIAKWKQSTIYLQTGQTHSCHHPSTHAIPTGEIEQDPSSLHNTERKVGFRRELLRGIQTPDCNYCWRVEDLGQTSDRVLKSTEPWARPYFEEARDNLRVNPSYLEVSFDSTCNLKCAYCGPTLSSKWQEEIEEHGAYENGHQNPHLLKRVGRWPQLNREHNPYKEAFWEWWPSLYPDLHVFRITGGEPLLSKDTWRVLDWILENPSPDLTVSINTNLSVPDPLIRKLVEYAGKLQKNVQRFEVFTSAEAWGTQCEYIRYPMVFEKFWQNFYYLTTQVPHVTMMSTVNLLALESLPTLMEEGLSWGSKFIPYSPSWSLPMLQEPSFLDPRLAPEAVKYTFTEKMADVMRTACAYNHEPFNRLQTEIERCVAFVNDKHPKREINIDSFKRYIYEYDKRRSLHFKATFPLLNQHMKVYK